MKNVAVLIPAIFLFAAPAMAQQPTAEQYIGGLQVTISNSLTQIKTALVQRDQQIATLMKQEDADRKQIADLTKERDALKATPAPKPPAEH